MRKILCLVENTPWLVFGCYVLFQHFKRIFVFLNWFKSHNCLNLFTQNMEFWIHFELIHPCTKGSSNRFNLHGVHPNWFILHLNRFNFHMLPKFKSSHLNRFILYVNRFRQCIFEKKKNQQIVTPCTHTYKYNLTSFDHSLLFSLLSFSQKHKKTHSS